MKTLLLILLLSFGFAFNESDIHKTNFIISGITSFTLKEILPEDMPIRKDLVYNFFYGTGISALSRAYNISDWFIVPVAYIGWEFVDMVFNNTRPDGWDIVAYIVGHYFYKGVFIENGETYIPLLSVKF